MPIFIILEKRMATHSSILAWRTPGTGATVHGVANSRTRLSNQRFSFFPLHHQWFHDFIPSTFWKFYLLRHNFLAKEEELGAANKWMNRSYKSFLLLPATPPRQTVRPHRVLLPFLEEKPDRSRADRAGEQDSSERGQELLPLASQGIFSHSHVSLKMIRLNPSLLNCRQIFYHWAPRESYNDKKPCFLSHFKILAFSVLFL